jgi:hypothetical protein
MTPPKNVCPCCDRRTEWERVDVALTMLDDMQKQLDELTRAVHAMAEAMVVIEDAHKLTNAYPFANGSHDAEIAHYANEGWSDKDIAEELGASATTVSRRRAALGIEPNNPRRRWGRLDDDMLKAACEKYRTWAEVSRVMPGRTPAALKKRAFQLGVSMNERGKPWDSESLRYLSENWEKGTPIDEIVRHLGRTYGACHKMASKMGLTESHARDAVVRERESKRFWKSKGVER